MCCVDQLKPQAIADIAAIQSFGNKRLWRTTASGRKQPVSISPKQTFERPVFGKAAAQPGWQVRVRNCCSPSFLRFRRGTTNQHRIRGRALPTHRIGFLPYERQVVGFGHNVVTWWSQRPFGNAANPRNFLKNMARPTGFEPVTPAFGVSNLSNVVYWR